MKLTHLLALPLGTLISAPALALDFRLVWTGEVDSVIAPVPPFQAARPGDPFVVMFEVQDMPTQSSFCELDYPVPLTTLQVQVGAVCVGASGSQFLAILDDCPVDMLDFGGVFPWADNLFRLTANDFDGALFDTNELGQLAGTLDLAPGAGAAEILNFPPVGDTSLVSGSFQTVVITDLDQNGPIGAGFCTSSANSSGNTARLVVEGSPSLADHSLALRATGLPAGKTGIFFYGNAQMNEAFGNGTRCVGGAVQRLPVRTVNPCGVLLEPDVFALTQQNVPLAPGTLYFQAWFRDVAAGVPDFDLSDAVDVVFGP